MNFENSKKERTQDLKEKLSEVSAIDFRGDDNSLFSNGLSMPLTRFTRGAASSSSLNSSFLSEKDGNIITTLSWASIMFMMVGQCLFTTANAIFKASVDQGIWVTDMLLIKSGVCLLLLVPILLWNKKYPFSRRIPRKTLKLCILRGFLCICMIYLYSKSFEYLPLTHANLIYMIFPFIASYLSYLINGEPLLPLEMGGMVACFSAIAVFTIASQSEQQTQDKKGGPAEYLFGVVLNLVSCTFYATMVVIIRKANDVHFSIVQFWEMLILCSFFGLVWVFNYVSNPQ